MQRVSQSNSSILPLFQEFLSMNLMSGWVVGCAVGIPMSCAVYRQFIHTVKTMNRSAPGSLRGLPPGIPGGIKKLDCDTSNKQDS